MNHKSRSHSIPIFQFLSSQLAEFISVLLALVTTLFAQTSNFSENQNMQLLAYKEIGSGKEKALVMHSWTGNSTSYDYILPHL